MSNDQSPNDDPSTRSLSQVEARKLFREIVANGDVTFTAHARKEMKKDKLHSPDVLNLLRGGIIGGAEWENGELRYHVSTLRMCAVVTVVSQTELRVITAWRIES